MHARFVPAAGIEPRRLVRPHLLFVERRFRFVDIGAAANRLHLDALDDDLLAFEHEAELLAVRRLEVGDHLLTGASATLSLPPCGGGSGRGVRSPTSIGIGVSVPS